MASGLRRQEEGDHGRPGRKDVLAEPGFVSGSLQVTDHRPGNTLSGIQNDQHRETHQLSS
jgi:hypothetical protein